MTSRIERTRTGLIRWRILVALDAGRPLPTNEQMLGIILDEVNMPSDQQEIRRELDYLRDLGLVELEGEETLEWSASLTARAVDIVDYRVANPPGIDRPRRRDLPSRK